MASGFGCETEIFVAMSHSSATRRRPYIVRVSERQYSQYRTVSMSVSQCFRNRMRGN